MMSKNDVNEDYVRYIYDSIKSKIKPKHTRRRTDNPRRKKFDSDIEVQSPVVTGFEPEIKPTEEITYNLRTDIAGQMKKSSEIARNQLKEAIGSKELKPNCK